MADTSLTAPTAPVPAAERGRTVIADKVVERVASIATSEIEAVIDTRTGWTKLIRKGLPHAEAVVAGGTSKITVEVAATWPTPLDRVAAQVREHVTRQVADLTGVTVTRVDVTVADVVHLEAADARVQ
ncbi:Uncharacterized conserved protein YloU, alkaline shock protein (Asp23) family [Nocardioides exalbidus]|uniref:Uncharacterized conserved protein YloU, alkaline shock protein (Asp23) family n=1 Tax=Nocardioides exalbidus TaxID=402596 RepID=A0A1H4KZK1_9ACTN|nr:Asp23/Gls24 family envelope stress response protein [Nocardioides exalbidus]SEB63921.1 Uncharacterized conserved protein YloU, alkaline shock protein (Asp23) family [Nocardioides exalbidus]